MAEMIRKILTSQVKAVEGKDRVLEFIGTTESTDRDNEVIKADAWQVDRYVKNPVVQWAHNYQEPPIGKTLSIRKSAKNETIFEIEFASKETYEFADTIFKLCKGGFLSATSVGFIPIESLPGKKEGDPDRTFTKVELLEISIVPVPSNPEALVTARSQGLITVKEFNKVKKSVIVPIPESEEPQDHKPKEVSQSEIKDELDYIISLIKAGDLNDENKLLVKTLGETIGVLQGTTIPVDIKSPIRSLVEPVIKMMDSHHAAHEKWYAGCKAALDAMCEMPEGEVEVPQQETFEEYVQKIINKKISEVK